jgi:hypothetical protein
VGVLEDGMASIFACEDLAVEAVYAPIAGGLLQVSAMLFSPSAQYPSLGQLKAVTSVQSAHLLQSEVPTKPRKGDLLTTSSGDYEVVEATADARNLRWLLVLTDA